MLILCLKNPIFACQKHKSPFGTRLAFFDRLFFLKNKVFLQFFQNLKNPPIEKWGFDHYFSLKNFGGIFDRSCEVGLENVKKC